MPSAAIVVPLVLERGVALIALPSALMLRVIPGNDVVRCALSCADEDSAP